MKHIVVGIDGSTSSVEALRLAVEIATWSGARVEALSVWQPYYGTVELPVPIENLEKKAREHLTEALTAIDPGDVEITEAVLEGDPATVLIERSRDADMLVVSTRGRGGFVGLLLGSVSQRCAQHASCPVLIARQREMSTRT